MRLLLDFFRAKPWSMLATVACLLVAGLAEGLALTSLLPLISIATGNASHGGNANRLQQFVVDALHRVGLEPTIGSLLLVIPVLFTAKSALLLFARRQNGYAVARVVRDMRLRLLRALLQARWSYFVMRPVGSFANAYATEAERTAKAYFNSVTCVAMAIRLAFYVAIAVFTASWQMTFASLAFAGAVVWTLRGLVRMARRGGTRQSRLMREVMNSLTDVLQGLKPLKSMAREDLAMPWVEEPTRRLERSWRKQVVAREALGAIGDPIFIGLVCLGAYVMWQILHYELGEVMLLAAVLASAFSAISGLQRRYQEVVVDESAYHQLKERIEEAEAARERLHGGAEPTLRQSIEVRGVAFDHGRTPLFENLSLEIRAGEITALVGPSGAGKTSIADLVAGIVEPRAGEILLDSVPLSKIDLTRWRQRIGYVPQEPFLLHESIAINVSLGDPEISRADVERALRAAHAWEFIEAMPEGMDTLVGERGASLSGGQRQRISIARALVLRPSLLVLDEATTALDPDSEAAVWQAMKELRGQATILAISHQQALLEVADRVYRIQGGEAEPIEASNAVAY